MNNYNAPIQIIKPLPDPFSYSADYKINQTNYLAFANCLSQRYGSSMEIRAKD